MKKLDRFNDKWVEHYETGCWEWHRARDRHGYGKFCWNGANIPSHRASWMLYFGDIPEKLLVMHICDNRKCVNPIHLRLGSHKDNMDDMIMKGRGANGSGKYNIKKVKIGGSYV